MTVGTFACQIQMDREYDFGEPDMCGVQQHILPGLRLREQEELRLPYPESWFESMSGSQIAFSSMSAI
jgi:hypothetical protein